MRRGEQPIDQPLVSLRRLVVQEIVDLLRRRRQAEQIEIQPPHQRDPLGLAARRKSGRFQPRQHEAIDRVARPRGCRGFRNLRLRHRPICPELFAFLDIDPRWSLDRFIGHLRRRRPASHPLLEQFDRLVRQFAGGRHLVIAAITNRLNQQTPIGPAGHDGRPVIAAAQPSLRRIEPQPRLNLRRPHGTRSSA